MSKFIGNTSNYYKHAKTNKILHLGVVISNRDDSDAGRIRVRIKGLDDHITNTNELSYAFPLLQKFVHVVPKNGETVWVITPDMGNPYMDRVYIGPIISQPQNLEMDPHVASSTAGLSGGFSKLKPAPSTIPENHGVYPKVGEIAIQGRNNTDIIFKDSEVLIRAGKFRVEDKINGIPKFNKNNPGYIQIKQDIKVGKRTLGVTSVVNDKINLLTHQDGSPRFNLNNQDTMISDEEMQKILEKAHPLVFGDLLIEYLELFKEALLYHVHPYNGMVPEDMAGMVKIKKFLEFDVSKIISKNIKIN